MFCKLSSDPTFWPVVWAEQQKHVWREQSVCQISSFVIPSLLLGVCPWSESALPSSAFLLHDSIPLFLSAHWLVHLLFPSAVASCIHMCVLCITGGVFICVRLSCQQSWYTDIRASLGWLQLARYNSSIILWILCYPSLASYGSESFVLLHICVFLTNQISLSYQLSLLTSSNTPLLGHMDHIDIQTRL